MLRAATASRKSIERNTYLAAAIDVRAVTIHAKLDMDQNPYPTWFPFRGDWLDCVRHRRVRCVQAEPREANRSEGPGWRALCPQIGIRPLGSQLSDCRRNGQGAHRGAEVPVQ